MLKPLQKISASFILALSLSACATYVENRTSEDFVPRYDEIMPAQAAPRANGSIYKKKACPTCSPNFDEKVSFSRSAPQIHQFSSKIASFQIRSAPQFHRFSQIFVENGQFSNKECARISQNFTNFRRKWLIFK